jgi:D-xylose transport system substrate-binding protein
MQFKRVGAILIALVLISGTSFQSGCTNDHNKLKKGGKVTVGFSMDTLKEERWYTDRADFTTEAKKLGANVICDVAYESSENQLKQVSSMIAQGINVLVIIPHDDSAAAGAVAMAKKAGIKVISYDRLVLKANVDLYITFDNVKVGELQAEAITADKPRGNYVIVDGPASDYNTIMIDRGIRDVLNPYIARNEIKVIKEFSTPDWMADEASNGINKLLQNNAKIDAVISENDSLAGGVITTLSDYQLIPEVPVVGMDADLAACQRVVEAQQLMTVYKPIYKLAEKAADFAVEMAKGDDPGFSDKISDGKYNVPYYAIEPEAVDNSNMVGTVIKDGFHTMDEVYMNVPASQWPVQ